MKASQQIFVPRVTSSNKQTTENKREFMNTRTKIKVIKKGTVKTLEMAIITKKTHEPDKTSKLTSTVSGWITEFRQRRQVEMELAIERFNL